MSRYIRRILIYLRMTMLFSALGALVLYIGGAPVVSLVIGKANMLIYSGIPRDLSENSTDQSLLIEEEEAVPGQSEGRVIVSSARIGAVECDRIALSAPLYQEDSDELLLQGAGHYPESGLPGEGKPILISGHDTTFFAPLEKIAVGDVVRIVREDKDYYYSIVFTLVTELTDTSAYDLSQDRELLILYTCYPFGQLLGDRKERYFVYGEPVVIDDTLDKE
jgi:sortase A